MSDSKYFGSSKGKGEVHEWREKINSTKKGEQKDGIKKIIAAMTTNNKDREVQNLFPDIVKMMQTDNLELKKLTYLYVMNYAKAQPEQAILAVNTFVKDCQDPNPLIRALAVRTMGCIRVNRITEYLCDPLRSTLKDDDPYVRKTAAVCVAKLYDIDPELVKDQGFIEQLRELLSDANPMVVANAVAALSEMHEHQPGAGIFDMSASTVSKLLTALNECTEWGQIFILDSLAIYAPKDQRELQSICERVAPRLQHVNAAVVLSAVKVVMKLMEGLTDPEYVALLVGKLAPPLVTLLSSEPEVQYVALRNINLIVQKRPEALTAHMKVFFVKYNDPIYVKLEKLDVMIRLASPSNITQVLSELKEYATEVDVDFVRKSVRAIGRCAIKIESQAQRCVDTLVDLIETKVNYVVQEAIIVIKDIFRKYPNKYESIIATLCENLEALDEPEAKAAMIWIVGEYADRIDNADELLESFLDNFVDESPQVQLALITGTVKLFLKRPSNTQELVQRILILATQECDNPDLRDRGFIYWRLLLTDPAAAKAVVLAEKPLISEETDMLEPSLLDELICHVSSLASVYHKPPSTFIESSSGTRTLAGAAEITLEVDLIGEDMPEMLAVEGLTGGGGGGVDLLIGGLGGTTGVVKAQEVYCTAEAGGGLEIAGAAAREDDQLVFKLTVSNKTAGPITNVKFKFNNNSFKLEAAAHNVEVVAAGGSVDYTLCMTPTAAPARMTPLNKLQVAFVKNDVEGFTVFDFLCPYYCLLDEGGRLSEGDFATQWGGLAGKEQVLTLSNIKDKNPSVLAVICDTNNVFKVSEAGGVAKLSMKFMNGLVVLAELTVVGDNAQVTLRSSIPDLFPPCNEIFTDLIVVAPPASLI